MKLKPNDNYNDIHSYKVQTFIMNHIYYIANKKQVDKACRNKLTEGKYERTTNII